MTKIVTKSTPPNRQFGQSKNDQIDGSWLLEETNGDNNEVVS